VSEPESVVEYAIDALRDAIREGRLAQGQRLVVADVTRMLGVSNGPVREAIRRLTGEGLVEITPHRGASVRTFTPADVAEIFQLREVLEGLAARLAAERIGHRDYADRLSALQSQAEALLADGRGYIEHNQAFHELIYEIAGSARLREQARQLTLPIYRLRFHRLMEPASAHTSATEHARLARAILDGDGPLAERLMQHHIRSSGEAMLAALEAAPRARRPLADPAPRPRKKAPATA